MDSKSTLAGLPVELREEIILHLGTNDLLALSGTNKEFFKLCTAPKLWSANPTGHNLLWGYDSERVLARLNMERYRDPKVVTISSRYGHRNEQLTTVDPTNI